MDRAAKFILRVRQKVQIFHDCGGFFGLEVDRNADAGRLYEKIASRFLETEASDGMPVVLEERVGEPDCNLRSGFLVLEFQRVLAF